MSLKDFFLVEPTTTFPKSHTYVDKEIFSRLTAPVTWKALLESNCGAFAAPLAIGGTFPPLFYLAEAGALASLTVFGDGNPELVVCPISIECC